MTGHRRIHRTHGRGAAAAAVAALGLLAGATGLRAQTAAGPEGFHGATTCERVAGWAWNPARPDEVVRVDVFHGDSLIATVPADLPREDLRAEGMGNGVHGFLFALPEAVREAGSGLLELRVAGTGVRLARSPQPVPCPGYADPVEASSRGAVPAGGAAKRVQARRVARGSIEVDGELSESAWSSASFADDFLQRGPDRGYVRKERTQVAFLYDDEAIYVAARMQRAGPQPVRAQLVRRDEAGNLERLLVSFDTFRDRRTAYTFGITTAGVRLDYYHAEDHENRRDDSFDPVWQGRTLVEHDGWTAELRIPFSQLRFPDDGASTWGVNVRRFDPSTFLNVYWVVVPVNETGWASRFGELVGLEGVVPRRRFEVTPYVLGGTTTEQGGSGVPEETSTRFGGEAKLGLGPSLTLDAAVNPDFGQVEADPAEVNLTQFETSFDERRPFFQEGAQLLQGSGPRYFYSRRVGGIPWGVPRRNLLDRGGSSNILGALKLTGRLDSGLSVGGLAAVTGAADGEVFLDGATGRSTAEVSPRSAFAVARLQQELGRSGSRAGLLLTGVHRELPDGGFLRGVLARDAISGGADWHLRFADGGYVLSGWGGFSHIAGEPEAILRIQQSAAHYFQRPDASHVAVDSAATSMSGYTAGMSLEKQAGAHWLWELGGAAESPGFEIRDAGAFDSADDLDAFATLRFRHLRPMGPIRNLSLALTGSAGWNFEGLRRSASAGAYGYFTLRNFWRTYAQVGYAPPGLSDELTWGGPLMGTPAAWTGGVGLANSFASPTQWSLDGEVYSDELGGWSVSGSASLSVPISRYLLLSVTPGYTRGDDTRQFLATVPDGPEATYGTRYVFGLLDRSEIYTQLRLDVSPVPDLTLELYAEPFVSSGRFHDPGELAAAGSVALRHYGTDGTTLEPAGDGSQIVTDGEQSFALWSSDFLVRSFRSNAVLRWEWRRGSSLFLIWQQNRWAWNQEPHLLQPDVLWEAASDPGENIFTVKLTYWLGS